MDSFNSINRILEKIRNKAHKARDLYPRTLKINTILKISRVSSKPLKIKMGRINRTRTVSQMLKVLRMMVKILSWVLSPGSMKVTIIIAV